MKAQEEIPGLVYCCGDCAYEIREAGGRRADEVAKLPYGILCQVHPSHLPAQPVTNAMVVKEGWKRAPREDVHVHAPFPSSLPLTMGPLTEITTRLVVAWSTSDRMTDPVQIGAAVEAARQILGLTNGA